MTPYFETKNGSLFCGDALERMQEKAEYSTDVIYSDVPYALGSEVIIRPDGKVDYKKASDFMNKWEMPTGVYWEQFFKEAFRMLKHGGYCCIFGCDRQLLLFKYYAALAGFEEHQSLYWYFCSSFPKSADLSKMLDKNAGAEREVVGQGRTTGKSFGVHKGFGLLDTEHKTEWDISSSSSDLAKKYDGYKYSIAPLKQTNETIMVFHKPYKTGSCLHDTLAYEAGDKTCCCGALNIEVGRVSHNEPEKHTIRQIRADDTTFNEQTCGFKSENLTIASANPSGRFPPQTFVDSEAAQMLDEQSGISKGNNNVRKNTVETGLNGIYSKRAAVDSYGFADIGGCSKILHKCDYEKDEHDLYFYCPKVSKSERNAGCEDLDKKERVFNGTSDTSSPDMKDVEERFTTAPAQNNHPTVKPIALNTRILTLFKTPNPQSIFIPFSGSGSEIIGAIKAGFEQWEAVEISSDYCKIAAKRVKKASEQFGLFEGKR